MKIENTIPYETFKYRSLASKIIPFYNSWYYPYAGKVKEPHSQLTLVVLRHKEN